MPKGPSAEPSAEARCSPPAALFSPSLPPLQVLAGFLVQHGGNAEVPRVADRLLQRLLDGFPSLQVGGGAVG